MQNLVKTKKLGLFSVSVVGNDLKKNRGMINYRAIGTAAL